MVLQPQERSRFEQLVVPHLDGAVNLARWLLRNRTDAEDVAQEAMRRGCAGVVAPDCEKQLLYLAGENRPMELMTEFDEELHVRPSANPETLATQADERGRLMRALESLSPRFREVLVLRELEGCSYKEIAEITGIPMGTVMSTLSRARERLQRTRTATATKEAS